MKIIRHLLVTGLVAFLAVTVGFTTGCQRKNPASPAEETHEGHSKGNTKSQVEYWTCSMHPQIKKSEPGKCPICGMTLVPVRSSEPSGASVPSALSGEEIHLGTEMVHQAGVQVEKAARRQLSREILVFGNLGYDLNRRRNVVPLVSGRIDRQLVDFNQTEVKEGAPLVSLYSPEAVALQEDYLKAKRERWLSTFYERKLLDSMVALAEQKLRQIGFADDELNALQEKKKPFPNLTIRAPASGSIVENMVQIGDFVKADQILYTIVPLDEMWFNAQVFEPDLGLLKTGQEVRITAKAFPGEKFTGRLVFIGRSLDVNNRTVPVRFVLPNPQRRLLPNLSASGVIEIPLGNSVLCVPNSAILDLGTRHVVYVQKNENVYLPRNVQVGQTTPHYTEILEGISEDEPVVVAGTFLIDAQAQLRSGSGGGMVGMPDMPGMEGPKKAAPAQTPASAPSTQHQH